jgi:hypothetical protein
MSCDWISCIDHHFQENGNKITGQECITKVIMGRWDHMDRIWTYQNKICHKNDNQRVSWYKIEALYRRHEEHAGLVERICAFQIKHIDDRQCISNLNYGSKRCCGNLANKYIVKAASPIRTEV